jgi:hypothetical protein
MMGISSYVPGDWTGVVTEGFVAVLGPTTAFDTAERLWVGAQAQDQMSFIDGLSVLAAEGFGAMPPFALAVRGTDGVTHVAVRGDVVVDAQVGPDAVSIDGHGVATWTERSLGGVQAMGIRVPGAADGPDLPLVAGVVRVGGLRSPHGATIGGAEESSADSEEPAPEPVPLSATAASEPIEISDVDQELTLVGTLDPIDAVSTEDDSDAYTIMSSAMAEVRETVPEWNGEDAPPAGPAVAPLVLSTGLVVALDRPVLLGRAPQAARVSSREMPRLVAVPSPQQDISRTHAEVKVEGDDVLVTDLDSTNGVHVLRPGRGARRLRPGEPRVLAVDETIDLGDGVTFVVERMQ